MQGPEFRALERALIAAGVAPRFVMRTIQELGEHLEDIEADALANGVEPEAARIAARLAIGTDDAILNAVAARPELKSWHCRWPRCAAALREAGYYACLPLAPFLYCAQHGGAIVRWSASASLGAVVTGALLFSMQLALN